VEDGCLIGSGAIVLNRSVIGAGSIVAAAALVAEGFVVPPASLVAGVPGVVRRSGIDQAGYSALSRPICARPRNIARGCGASADWLTKAVPKLIFVA